MMDTKVIGRMPAIFQTETAFDLLHTKLTIPAVRDLIIPRSDLFARLDGGLRQKLTLLSAPAGFGKSTLVSAWLAERLDHLPAAWVSLDAGDNDPLRFWRYVFAAIQGIDFEASQAGLSRLQRGQPQFEAALTALINALVHFPGTALLVLEDFHLITNSQIYDTLAFLLDHLPPALHLMLITRADPPLPLARLRAAHQVCELRAPDLRFTEAETRAFLQQSVPHPLAPETMNNLITRAEGWPAGLRLMALSVQSRGLAADQERFLESFTGSHRPVIEFLLEDVLAVQEEDLQAFLLETSFLDRLTGPLCDAVTGRSDSTRMLERLVRANLFIEPLDGGGRWYRYHALFAEAMQHEARHCLGEAHVRELSRRASRWYDAHGMPVDAVEAALFSEDFAWAAERMEHMLEPRLVGNEHYTLIRWIESVPEEVLRGHPRLCMALAQAIVFTTKRPTPGLPERVRAPLEMAEQYWTAQASGCAACEANTKLGELFALRALMAVRQGDYSRAFPLARQALARLPEVDESGDWGQEGTAGWIEWRGICLIITGREAHYAGKLNAATQSLVQARGLLVRTGNIYGLVNAAVALGEVYAWRGEPQQAAELFHHALAEIENAAMDPIDAAKRQGRLLAGLGELAFDRDDLPAAESAAIQALSIAEELGSDDLLLTAAWLFARVEWAKGEVSAARSRLDAVAARMKQPMLLRLLGAWQAWLALAAGDLASARRWSGLAPQSGPELPLVYREPEVLALARVRLAHGDAAGALHLLEPWLADAQTQGRARSELEIGILIALARLDLGQPVQARQILARALLVAPSQLYSRLFLTEGESLFPLLREIAEGHDAPAAAARNILPAMPTEPPAPRTVNRKFRSEPYWEPLTDKEERVLQLLAGGLSNAEIAQELVISVNTVKTHIKSIYRKLQVNSRQALRAAVRSRQLPV